MKTHRRMEPWTRSRIHSWITTTTRHFPYSDGRCQVSIQRDLQTVRSKNWKSQRNQRISAQKVILLESRYSQDRPGSANWSKIYNKFPQSKYKRFINWTDKFNWNLFNYSSKSHCHYSWKCTPRRCKYNSLSRCRRLPRNDKTRKLGGKSLELISTSLSVANLFLCMSSEHFALFAHRNG